MDFLRTQVDTVLSSLDNELNSIQSYTSSYTNDIERLIKERDELAPAPYRIKTGRIYLDVGGMHYTSTYETLTAVPDSLIGAMFSGRYPVQVQDDGRVLIDRDGTHFGLILRFLRDPQNTVIKMKDKSDYEEFKTEVQFYGLSKAMFGDVDTSIPEKLDWIENNRIKVHSFSSQYSGFPCSNTLDPNVTYWLSESGQTTNQWIVYEFPAVAYINKIMMKVDGFECTAKDWMVQVTEDDEPTGEWNTVKEFQAQCGNNCYSDQFFEGFDVRARYVRLFFRNNWGSGGGSYILVTNVKFYGGLLQQD